MPPVDPAHVPRRSPAPQERKLNPDATRAALLDAALEEFSSRGYAGARVRDITSRAGVSKDLVAYHYGGKDGLYQAVAQAWLRREQTFSDPDVPLAELAGRYLHDALSDPRLMRLLAWRGLTEPTPATRTHARDLPPDTEELDGIRRRQRSGELHAEVDPATLRLVLLGAVAAPIVFPTMAARLFGAPVTDPAFETHYRDGLARIVTLLAGDPRAPDGEQISMGQEEPTAPVRNEGRRPG